MHGARACVAGLIEGLCKQSLPGSGGVAVMPASLFTHQVIEGLKATSIIVGAQDAAIQAERGALTGEVASSQLADAGCKLVLVGHSERRQLHGATKDTQTQKKETTKKKKTKKKIRVQQKQKEQHNGQTLEVGGRH
ncbi:triose-phosphate isomerase, partial [Pseudomonas syringae]